MYQLSLIPDAKPRGYPWSVGRLVGWVVMTYIARRRLYSSLFNDNTTTTDDLS